MNQFSDRTVLAPGGPLPDAAYDADFALWSERQAYLLRQGRLNELDRENLIEELEAIGSSQREALESRLVGLLTHLLTCQFQQWSARRWKPGCDNPPFQPHHHFLRRKSWISVSFPDFPGPLPIHRIEAVKAVKWRS